MSGMDRLTELQVSNQTLEWLLSSESGSFEMDASAAQSMARELLAHRRASQAAPAPSDGLREAVFDLVRSHDHPGDANYKADRKLYNVIAMAGDWRGQVALTDEELQSIGSVIYARARSPAPAQEGGE